MRITVVHAPAPRQAQEWALRLEEGATVQAALQASGLAGAQAVGVWGKRVALDQVLADGDRVEVYRPLQVDPKLARRERFRSQGARAAGLFAKKKTGS